MPGANPQSRSALPMINLLLAQDFAPTFSQRYFSYIVLGLMMCIGYVVLRVFNKPPPPAAPPTEQLLREAEAEARLRAEERRIAEEERRLQSALASAPEEERLDKGKLDS